MSSCTERRSRVNMSSDTTSASVTEGKRVEPVFFLNTDVDQSENNWLNTLEVCLAVCGVVAKDSTVEGAQRIGGLWRIYVTEEEARVSLLATGISLRGQQITLKDRNPFLNIGFEGVDTTRLFVRNIPLSYDNTEIQKALKDKGVEMIGSLKYARARTPAGKLTNFKTGDRFVDMVIPKEPLPKKMSVGIFTASLYHKEQKLAVHDIECGNCKQKGHKRKDCKNEPVCYACMQQGHKKGDETCPAFTKKAWNRGDDNDSETDSNDSDNDDDDVENGDEGTAENEYFECNEVNTENVVKIKLAEVRASANTDDTHLADSQSGHNSSELPGPSGSAESQIKGQQLLTKLWDAATTNKPSTPHSRTCSPARVRRMEDRSPEESVQHAKKEKKKKQKK